MTPSFHKSHDLNLLIRRFREFIYFLYYQLLFFMNHMSFAFFGIPLFPKVNHIGQQHFQPNLCPPAKCINPNYISSPPEPQSSVKTSTKSIPVNNCEPCNQIINCIPSNTDVTLKSLELSTPLVINATLSSTCTGDVPICVFTIFNENFLNFQIGINWNIVQISTVPLVICNDGQVIQGCDCITLDSSLFQLAIDHPFTSYHFLLQRPIPFNAGFNGTSIEFTISEMTKFVNKITSTSFGSYYECSGADFNQDFRPAYSAVGLTNFGAPLNDIYSVYVVMCKKKIYLLYGIDFITTNTRDRFHCAIPVLDRKGLSLEKFKFNLSLRWDGSIELRYFDPLISAFKCLVNVPNIAQPLLEKKYVVDLGSRDQVNFNSSNITITDDLQVIIGNFMGMQMMEPVTTTYATNISCTPYVPADKLAEKTLYEVPSDLPDLVYRYLCPGIITPSVSTTSLASTLPISTSVLNYGQGSVLKICNLNACYI